MTVKHMKYLLIFIGILGFSLALSACEILETQEATALTPDEAIAESVRAYLDKEGSLGDMLEVEIELLEGDFARVKIISTDPAIPAGFTGFLRRQDGPGNDPCRAAPRQGSSTRRGERRPRSAHS